MPDSHSRGELPFEGSTTRRTQLCGSQCQRRVYGCQLTVLPITEKSISPVFVPSTPAILPTLSGFVGSCNLRRYTNVTWPTRRGNWRFPQLQYGTSGAEVGLSFPKAPLGGI